MQLNKFLAQSGVCSRRNAVKLIKDGLVTVNGVSIQDPSYRVQERDVVRLYDQMVKLQSKIYIIMNKPKDCITTTLDDSGRRSVVELLDRSLMGRVFPVGRLDRNTTGILILTNDGNLSQRLSHPRYEIQKVYAVTLKENLTQAQLNQIQEGIRLYDGFIKVDEITYVPRAPKSFVLVSLHSGKNRIVRRIFESFGHRVKKLDRIGYAGLDKSGVEVGTWRHLTAQEVLHLKSLCDMEKKDVCCAHD